MGGKELETLIQKSRKTLGNIRWELYHHIAAVVNNSLDECLPKKTLDGQSAKTKEETILCRGITSKIVGNLLSDENLSRMILTILEANGEEIGIEAEQIFMKNKKELLLS